MEGHRLLLPEEGGHDDSTTHFPTPPLPMKQPGTFFISLHIERWEQRAENSLLWAKTGAGEPGGTKSPWLLLPVCLWENWTNSRGVKTFNKHLGGERSPKNVEVIAEKGFAKTSTWLAISLGSSSPWQAWASLRLETKSSWWGDDGLRLDLKLKGDVDCSGYQSNGTLEGSKEPAILYAFSTWDVMDQL